MTVSGVGEEALFLNTNVTQLTLPGSITNFAPWAFWAAEVLTNAVLEDGITTIGEGMFSGCPLASITIPGSVVTIENAAFNVCLDLTNITIPNGVKSIEGSAFAECGLTTISIPASVTNIEDAFPYCTSLTNVILPAGLTGLSGAFGECSNLQGIIIPPSVTDLGSYTFYECSSLTNIEIPSSITNIGEYSFYSCSSLTNFIIPGNVLSVGDNAFAQCSNLSNIAIANGALSLGSEVFQDCTSLRNLTTPVSVTSIGSDVCENSSLTNLSILGAPSVGEYAFSRAPLRSAYIAGGNVGIYAFQFCTNLTNLVLGGAVTSIGGQAFGFDPILNIVIPPSVTNIGYGAFEDCGITNLTISDGVTTIGGYAFLGNPLTSVFLPGTVNITDDQVFFDCTNLTNVTIGAGVSNLSYGMFGACDNLTSVLFLGNPPGIVGTYPSDGSPFANDTNVTVYYMPGTTGWSTNYQGAPTALWNPIIEAGDGNFGVINGQFGFDIKGDPGIPIMVEACTNLADPVWTPVQSMTVTNGLVYFIDPNWSNYPTRYYGIGFP